MPKKKAKNTKRVKRFKESGKSIISDEINIPNHSGMLDAGKVHRTPTDDLDPVNKKYVDDQFPVTHASTTGKTTDDHHAQDHQAEHEVGGGDLINHNDLTGFVGNEHIDWTNATENFTTTGYSKSANLLIDDATGTYDAVVGGEAITPPYIHVQGNVPRLVLEGNAVPIIDMIDLNGDTDQKRMLFHLNFGNMNFQTFNDDATAGATSLKLNLATGKATMLDAECEALTVNDTAIFKDDLYFVGTGAGLVYGSCYGNHFGWTQANAVQNVWYNISDAAIVSTNLNDVTHDGNGKLTVEKAGKYKIDYSITWENNTANDHIDVGIEVNGSASTGTEGRAHEETKFANVDHAIGSACILNLNANDTIELAIRTIDNNTPTLTVDSLNLVCVQIGG